MFSHDLRFAIRQLSKSPAFALTAVLTLALGIGATTAMFSLVEGMLLRDLPFTHPDRLVLLGDHLGGNPGISVTAREIGTYPSSTSAFSSMGGYISATYELSGDAYPEQIHGARFNAGVFQTLGVSPIVGRVFSQKEEDEHQPLAVISYAMWLTRYHRDRDILGKPIVLDRKAYSIIGVMPGNFEFPLEPGRLDQAQLWVPMSLSPDELSDGHAGFWGYQIVARLKDGIALSQAAKDADRVAQQFVRTLPEAQSAIRLQGDVEDLRNSDVEDMRPVLRALFLAVTVVLLLACANVAGLWLVRAIRRRREYAIRLALGAGTRSVLREMILEGILLSISGALLGLLFAAAAIRMALHLLPESMPRIDSISIDAGVAAFAFAIALATGLCCSLAPGFAALRTNVSETMKEGLQSGTGRSGHSWLRSALVVAELAIALVLVTASAAFLRSFQKMRAEDPGFRADHVVVAGFQLPLKQYPSQASADLFSHEVLDKLAAKPGVRAAAIASAVPGSESFAKSAYTVEGETASNWKLRFAAFISTDGDYFQTMTIPLLAGRYFTDADRSGAPAVVIINESMAKRCWPGESAIGKHFHAGGPTKSLPWATVVGVVADTKGARDQPSMEQYYVPAAQPETLYGPDFNGRLTGAAEGYVVFRSALPAAQELHTLRASVAEVDPLLALDQAQAMTEVVSNDEAPRRFNTDLITLFAFAGLLLAVTGIYGVVAFSVALRAHEIAIRMALGEQRVGIARLVLMAAAKLALLGCVVGLLGSLAASRVISSFLFQVSGTDPIIYGAAVALMMVVTLLAAFSPALRAAAADPNTVLRAG
ncbi:MAG TPA: ABC transporter permease [Candidatus Sulfotelmatobacter sp.]|nr:ABC transporter permease [Candidatus Sulfotelmatobacter sp.]